MLKLSSSERELLRFYRSLNPRQKDAFQRLSLMLLNGSNRAERLAAMFEAGQISAEQMLNVVSRRSPAVTARESA